MNRRKTMTIVKKNELPSGKKCIFISRGNENALSRWCSNFKSYCLANSLEDSQDRRESKNQEIGSGNESKRNERKHNIFLYPRNETLIFKKHIRRGCYGHNVFI